MSIPARRLTVSSSAKKAAVFAVLKEGKSVTSVAREFGVARKTVYSWIKKYKEAPKRIKYKALETNYKKGRNHPKAFSKSLVDSILEKVVQTPELSIHNLARVAGVSSHGLYNVLKRNGLTYKEARLAYSRARKETLAPKPIPVGFWDRIRLVWEQFIPSLAPAPPPSLRRSLQGVGELLRSFGEAKPSLSRFLKPFFISSFLAFLISFGTLSWISILGAQTPVRAIGLILATLALFMGSIFFLYSLKYYLSLAIVLSFSQQPSFGKPSEGKGRGILSWILGLGNGRINGKWKMENAKSGPVGLTPNLEHIVVKRHPKISVHIPLYNERNVVDRLLTAVSSFDYPSTGSGQASGYEVIIADDSTDETTKIALQFLKGQEGELREIKGNEGTEIFKFTPSNPHKPSLTLIHRLNRSGFKGGALREALRVTDPKAEFITVFDADFVPYPDTLELFLKYFQATAGTLDFREASRDKRLAYSPDQLNANSLDAKRSSIAAVQGYQWHVLNKSENWITRGVRSEYAGSYVIERSGSEIYTGLKQISGAVYMIRRDVLEEIGWETSITEDFQLTLKLYEKGYKVVYTPYIQAPAECVSTLKRLIRQRMRWAEGHSNNVRRMFWKLLVGRWVNLDGGNPNQQFSNFHFPISNELRNSQIDKLNAKWQMANGQSKEGKVFIKSPLTLSEKLEFLYLSPYYLQAFFFLVGTISWLISEAIFPARLPFWTSLWGWSLVLTNMLSLPLMNTVGLFLEESEERDYLGLASFIAMSYILVPFQAYAAVKGFIQKEEGPWFRTPKTGKITDIFTRGKFYRFISGILPGRSQVAPAHIHANKPRMEILRMNSNKFGQFKFVENSYLSLATANNRFDSFEIKKKRISWVGKVALVSVLTLSIFVNSMVFTAKPVEATWYSDTNYLYRKALTIDETLVSGSADHSNFPILVSYTDVSLKTTANGGRVTNSSGFDIIFTNDDKTTKLDHEIEKYTATTGEIVMWVRIPTLPYNVDKDIYIYYGNSSISSSQENITGVWDTNYKGVWHLKEDPAGTAPQMKDSTSGGYHGTSNGAMTAADQVAGKIGGSLDFDGTDDYISFSTWFQMTTGETPSGGGTGTVGTYEFWLKRRAISYWKAMIGGGINDVSFGVSPTSVFRRNDDILIATYAFAQDTWYHVVVTWDNVTARLYLNGVQDKTDTINPLLNVKLIGVDYSSGTDEAWPGFIDEVRVSNSVRSAGWITTEYNNQANQGTGAGKFIKTLGTEEQVPELVVLLLPVALVVPFLVRRLRQKGKLGFVSLDVSGRWPISEKTIGIRKGGWIRGH